MTRDEIRATVLEVRGEIAPEGDPRQVRPDVDLRDQLDIDSMDFQSFVIRLHQRLRVDIPERDYPRCGTLGGRVDYLSSALGS